ncbi:MAG: hypothetical protein IPJ39_22170 [Saprospiraceae bacterium]|nr:hypothetical protein [Saprospiraceae bacterium]
MEKSKEEAFLEWSIFREKNIILSEWKTGNRRKLHRLVDFLNGAYKAYYDNGQVKVEKNYTKCTHRTNKSFL